MSGKPEIVRSPEQIQRAHDILALFVESKELQDAVLGPDGLDRDATVKSMRSALDLLCWLLGHGNLTFVTNILKLEAELMKLGFEIYDAGRLVWPGKEEDGPLPS